jgi:hypothetical protein
MEVTKATFCVAVATQKATEATLVERFDAFATNHGMRSDKTSPVLIVYQNPTDKTYSLDLRLGMADLGTIVSFYGFERGAGSAVLHDLDQFVAFDIGRDWKVTPCADIPGFHTPEVRR